MSWIHLPACGDQRDYSLRTQSATPAPPGTYWMSPNHLLLLKTKVVSQTWSFISNCAGLASRPPAFVSGSIRAGKLPDLSRKVKNFLEEPALLSVFWVPEVTEMSSKVNVPFFSLPFSYSVFCLIAHWKKSCFIAFLLNQQVFLFSYIRIEHIIADYISLMD